jgi:hypothetical protein
LPTIFPPLQYWANAQLYEAIDRQFDLVIADDEVLLPELEERLAEL